MQSPLAHSSPTSCQASWIMFLLHFNAIQPTTAHQICARYTGGMLEITVSGSINWGLSMCKSLNTSSNLPHHPANLWDGDCCFISHFTQQNRGVRWLTCSVLRWVSAASGYEAERASSRAWAPTHHTVLLLWQWKKTHSLSSKDSLVEQDTIYW